MFSCAEKIFSSSYVEWYMVAFICSLMGLQCTIISKLNVSCRAACILFEMDHLPCKKRVCVLVIFAVDESYLS